jgi:5-(carboxyamino)imidazole ribonucleotide synthase
MKIGILGAGQLARMLTLAAYPLGFRTLCMDPTEDACSSQITGVIVADYSDEKALKKFLDQVDCVTYETENIPLACAEFIAKHRPLFPSAKALKIAQDRLFEKRLFQTLDIPVPDFFQIDSLADLQEAVQKIGLPAVLKTRRMGYDGKGQYVLKTSQDLEKACELFSNPRRHPAASPRDPSSEERWIPRSSRGMTAVGPALILEKWIPFEQEVSIIAVRNAAGEIRFYPLTNNTHREGILRFSEAPYHHQDLEIKAQSYARALLEYFNYVGVLSIEFFDSNGKLLANEMAPRVHNSGHWTIEGAETSQFENHLRAICDLPLGATETRGFSAMFNCIGSEPSLPNILAIPGAHFHSYGKAPKPQRKLGHVTLVENSPEKYEASLKKLKTLFSDTQT